MCKWVKVSLGDVCKTNVKTYSLSEDWSFVNYLDTGNITKNCIKEIQYLQLGQDDLPSRARRKVDIDDILYSTVRPNQRHYGIIKNVLPNLLVSTGFTVITVDKSKVDPDFLYYYLSQSDVVNGLHAIGEQSVSAYPSIKPSDIEGLELMLPPLTEQNKIGRTLRCFDAKIENNAKINHHLEQMAQAIFKSWFVDFEPFGGVMPSDWREGTLGELCVSVTKGTTPTTLKRQFVEQGINFIKAECIHNDHSIDFSKLAYIDKETNALLNRSKLNDNDIVFSIAGTLGRFAFVNKELLPANTNQAIAIIRADSSKINPVALYSFFVGGLHSDFYTRNIQQAVQANLSLTTIKALPIKLPPKEKLADYSIHITPIFERIFQNNTENRRLAELRDALLPRLMSGELSVSELSDLSDGK